MNPEMACVGDDWEGWQHQDETLQQREIAEAFSRIYLAVTRLESKDGCEYQTLREDIRFLELFVWRK